MLLLTIIQAVLFAAPEGAAGLRAASVTDGVRQLTDQLYACQMPDGSSLSDAIKSSAADLRLRELVRTQHLAKATPGDDAGWSLVQVSVADLIAALNNPSVDNALRKSLTPLAGTLLVAIGIAETNQPAPSDAPLGWETVSSNGVTMAIETAQDDALRQMLAANPGAATSPSDRAKAFRIQVLAASPKLHVSQVCTVTVPFELEGVKYEAIGYGVPPWSQVQTWSPASRRPPPTWAAQTLVATGRGATTGAVSSQRERAVACSTAKANALIVIATKVDELLVPPDSDSTMGAFIKNRPQYDAVWSAFLHIARPRKTEFADGVCAVEMTLDLGGLWHLFIAIEHLEADTSQLKNTDVR